MDEEFESKLSADHLERLRWFEDHAGQVLPVPQPLEGNRYLVSAPKGIFKPKEWAYALSIKIVNGSQYDDSRPIPAEGGGWLLSYHQEGEDPDFYTNAALSRCIRDRVPVGVLSGVSARPARYEVLGVALPVRWQDGYFYLESLNPRAFWRDYPAAPEPFIMVDEAHVYRRSAPPQGLSVGNVLDALQALRVQRTAGGQAKRHQPLTLLQSIGWARQHAVRLMGWPVVRDRVGNLIQEFGEASRDNAYLPFLALAGTDIWELTAVPPKGTQSSARRQWLNNANPVVKGGFTKPVYELLAGSSDAAADVALFLIDTYFDDMVPAEILRLMQATGLHDLMGKIEAPESQAPRGKSFRKGGAGRLADTKLRIEIENHAVRRAKDFYRRQGYEVAEVGKPYDLRAVRGSEELHVEVKGSIMSADQVELTINEVRHAREIRTDLYVVDQIQWTVQVDGTITTAGGRERRWPDWQPDDADLSPTRFRHRLPQT